MAQNFLVLSALGTDRPGLVAELSGFLAERGANVEESRMVTLGAEFGVMLLLSGDEAALARVQGDLISFRERSGLQVLAKATRNPLEQRAAATIPYEIKLEAIDREGIIHALSSELHRLGLNIIALETSAYSAPFSGGTLFRLEGVVDVPPGKKARELRDCLTALADRENLDVEVKARS